MRVYLAGSGIAANLFLYCLQKRIGSNSCGVTIYSDGVFGRLNPDCVCMYIYEELDEFLTTERKVRVKMAIVGRECRTVSYGYKIMGRKNGWWCKDEMRINIKEDNNFYSGEEFIKNLNSYNGCHKNVGINTDIDYDNNDDYDYVIWTKPIYNLMVKMGYDYGVITMPIGVRTNYWKPNIFDIPLQSYVDTIYGNPKCDYIVYYNVYESDDWYRATYDIKNRRTIKEYSLPYKDNAYRAYDLVLNPGKFIPNGQVSIFKHNIKESNIRLLGRYAEWEPGLRVDNIYSRCEELVKEILKC
jgi:hypothetical protein